MRGKVAVSLRVFPSAVKLFKSVLVFFVNLNISMGVFKQVEIINELENSLCSLFSQIKNLRLFIVLRR